MLRIFLILGPLILVAVLAHPIMLSAQPTSVRVKMLQAEPREISNLPALTIERRHPLSHATPEGATDDSESEANLRKTLEESKRAADTAFSQGPVSFEKWKEYSNRATVALQKLFARWNKPSDSTVLRNIRARCLKQYLMLLNDDKSGHDLTETGIEDVVARARVLRDTSVDKRRQEGWAEGWEQVLKLMKDLKAGNPNEQLQPVLASVEMLIRQYLSGQK